MGTASSRFKIKKRDQDQTLQTVTFAILVSIIDNFIRSNSSLVTPMEIIYLCAEYYGYKSLRLYLYKIYPSNMPNQLQLFRSQNNKNEWIKFDIYSNYNNSNISDNSNLNTKFNSNPASFNEIISFTKNDISRSIAYIPQFNYKLIPFRELNDNYMKNIINKLRTNINTTHVSTISTLIKCTKNKFIGLMFKHNLNRDNIEYIDYTKVYINSFEFKLPSIHTSQLYAHDNTTNSKLKYTFQIVYSSKYESLFAYSNNNTSQKPKLYKLFLYNNNEWKWNLLTNKWNSIKNAGNQLLNINKTRNLCAEKDTFRITLIDNDSKLFAIQTIHSYSSHSNNVKNNINSSSHSSSKKYIATDIYDFNNFHWKSCSNLNNDILFKNCNIWYNPYRERIYCFGDQNINNCCLYYYDLYKNNWYSANNLILKNHNGYKQDGNIKQLSIWNDYDNNLNLLYSSMSLKNRVLVQCIDEREPNKEWMIDKVITNSIGHVFDPCCMYPYFC